MTNYRLTPLRDTSANKERIMEHTRSNIRKSPAKSQRNWRHALIAACTVIVALLLAGPSIYQALFNKQNFTVEKVVFPETAYDALINSIYLDETNEFVYRTENGFYSFDVANKQQSLLMETSDWAYDYGVSENWLFWVQPVENEQKFHILNRKTNEVKVYENDFLYGIGVKGNTLIFMGQTRGDNFLGTAYKVMDLETGKVEVLREFEGGSHSRPAIDGSRIAISETVRLENGVNTLITVHDFEEINDIANYVLPYPIVQNVLLKGSKVYGYMWNEREGEPASIGTINMENGQFEAIEASVIMDGYATDGEHFAIEVKKGDTNTVQLFENIDGTLKRISSLPAIKERLVKPRFTEGGTLIVNGEGPDHAMYLIRFE
ncbi:hypothetical protein ACTHOQ_07960 [Solibacillus silvestris]|uniref:hypothetical protein n=1 Tax=Solibacillus silvestris TaxID=76853 RepID=UPI003F7D2BA9